MTDFVKDIAGCTPDYGQWTDPDFAEKTASRIAELEERYRLVVGDKINLRGRVVELEAQLNEDDKLIDECERVIKGLRDHLEAAEAKLAKAEEERNRQKARAEYFENNANAWRDKWGAAHDRAEAAEAKLAKAEEHIATLSNALREVRGRNNSRRASGLYDSKVHQICRTALKSTKSDPRTTLIELKGDNATPATHRQRGGYTGGV